MPGSFLLMVCPKTKRTLIGQRSADAEYSPNKWFSFGGTMEEGEDPACTAMRECFEETGITHAEYDISEQPIFTTQLPDHEGVQVSIPGNRLEVRQLQRLLRLLTFLKVQWRRKLR